MRQFIRFFAASSNNHPTFSPLPSEIEKKEVKFSVLNNLYLTLLSAISDQRRLIKIKSAELKREVERGSTFMLTSNPSCIASILFANINFTHVRTQKLRDSGNQPLVFRWAYFSMCLDLTERNFFPLSPQQRGSQTSFFSNKCLYSQYFCCCTRQ